MPLVVGLGNPGTAYRGTPHNVGFDVLANLAGRHGVRFRRARSGRADEAVLLGAPRLVLLKPLAFMNLSGGPVNAALHWHQWTPGDLLVICDDVNLPPGHLRLRPRGGAGGHKGLLSIIEHLHTEEFARLRIGVGGGEPGADVARHVLTRGESVERKLMAEALDQAADAAECLWRDGIETAMNRFNTRRTISDSESPSGGERPPDEPSPKGDE